ncbi:hypothetical protein E4U26_003542 [Claviceps purpurea]|nr:hypothetical protein E4U26_003542 [Claviceps purpurea]
MVTLASTAIKESMALGADDLQKRVALLAAALANASPPDTPPTALLLSSPRFQSSSKAYDGVTV